MNPFLQVVASDLMERFNGNLENVTLVFPGRRATLFFSNYLSKLIRKPVWQPQSITLSELMYKLSGLIRDDHFSLVARLYQVFKSVRSSDESFDSFFFWGEVMLSDFDQIDKYLVDYEKLFSNVKDIKEIEERFGGLSPEQKQILESYLGVISNNSDSELVHNYQSIWKVLGRIYNSFRELLLKEELCYEGLAYRMAVENIKSNINSSLIPDNIVFVGFNALNTCEQELFMHCRKNNEALFYWDYDLRFVKECDHEAGTFIRNNLTLFPNAISEDALCDNPVSRDIRIIAAPSTVTQAKVIPNILSEIEQQGGKLNETAAIVFPKENMLMPVIQSIPESVEKLNVTMGYPLKETQAYSLAENLIRLHISIRRADDNTASYYYRNVIALLNHPYIRICEPEQAKQLVLKIKITNEFYPSHDSLSVSPLLNKVFSPAANLEELCTNIQDVVCIVAQRIAKQLTENSGSNISKIELEFLYALQKCMVRLKGVASSNSFSVSPKVFLQVFRKAFVQERVSFVGEPLEGLQLMGFLETRALDFESVVILSFNDDTIPGRNHSVSFITPSLRTAYGLPDFRHHDAVYAYYFYRLLHRAKNVFLVYSSRTEGLTSGEPSRFALQLKYESMYGKVNTIPVNFHVDIKPATPISIEKTHSVICDLTSNLFKNEIGVVLSPSGLATYISCPLKFYFRYAVGIEEPDEVSEEIGAPEFGTIVHEVMEVLYKHFEGSLVTQSDIKSILDDKSRIEQVLDASFSKLFFKSSTRIGTNNISGRNLLARNAMMYTIKRILSVDLKRAPFHLISHEQKVYHKIELSSTDIEQDLYLGGIIDRLERREGTLQIIDYKTGNYNDKKRKFKSVTDLFNTQQIDNVKEVFQIFCYSLVKYYENDNEAIKPCLWFVKGVKPGENPNVLVRSDSKKYVEVEDFRGFSSEFQLHLNSLVEEIFDSSIPFTQTDKLNRCKSCPYKSICGRG
ncbi:MAG TPA: PD-(D/E)XK nuclease family protein [Tenuifilaceae bacterium]|nr:PD-(D/E)XK nuclease family protein [Tenuifilaceae bacterium]HPE18238.1 PD-(D/E)XK nuclease family protein [Tenuifilaceae bacterium]HPJ47148.1 PD-(D/E)XK nuclease family protein [Tenuifilaceae bacterium]HPQ35731.1 PD-(D/E)XK nuclease family protein [Tenuifilaceae bacterium]HRX69232.1 PD-(D/E)XK nuclease family protein [Tenuifilaceae bacterium]